MCGGGLGALMYKYPWRSPKRVSDALNLKLHALVNSDVGTGNQNQVLCKSNKHSYYHFYYYWIDVVAYTLILALWR